MGLILLGRILTTSKTCFLLKFYSHLGQKSWGFACKSTTILKVLRGKKHQWKEPGETGEKCQINHRSQKLLEVNCRKEYWIPGAKTHLFVSSKEKSWVTKWQIKIFSRVRKKDWRKYGNYWYFPIEEGVDVTSVQFSPIGDDAGTWRHCRTIPRLHSK